METTKTPDPERMILEAELRANGIPTAPARDTVTGVLTEEWEENGRDDSDWFVAVWDAEKQTVRSEQTGTTRGGMVKPILVPATPEERAKAKVWLEEAIFGTLRRAEHRDVFEPENVPIGGEVLVSEAHTFTDKRTGAEVELPVGTSGRVFWLGSFGTFYRNGYNRPGRSTHRVGIQLLDGRRAFLPLAKLRLAREPMADAELRTRARECAKAEKYNRLCSRLALGAWL